MVKLFLWFFLSIVAAVVVIHLWDVYGITAGKIALALAIGTSIGFDILTKRRR